MSGKKKQKNPIANCVFDAFIDAALKVFPNASFREPITWNSLTKGKVCIWIPKADKISKEQGRTVQDLACASISTDRLLREEVLKKLNVWDPDAIGPSLTIGSVVAIYICKYMIKFVKPGEEVQQADDGMQEWIFEIIVGQGAADVIAKEILANEPKENIESRQAKSSDETKTTSEISSKKKTADRAVNSAPSRSDVVSFAHDIVAMFGRQEPPPLEDLEQVLMMFHNQAYTKGFVAAASQHLSPHLANLQNRL